jgi:hypothetical protein
VQARFEGGQRDEISSPGDDADDRRARAGRGATTFVAMSERTLARQADAIVLGTVTGRDTVGTADGGIYTLVTLSIEAATRATSARRSC